MSHNISQRSSSRGVPWKEAKTPLVENAGDHPEKLLTPKDVADMLQMSSDWVRDHAAPAPGKKARRSPVIPVIRLGGKQRSELRFRRADVMAFIERNYITGA